MAKKLQHGLSVYEQLVDLIMELTPTQAKNLYSELCPRYNKRMRTILYNERGEEDINGKVRLTSYQHKAIRTKFGDSFMLKAYKEVTDYVIFLENMQDGSGKYRSKLQEMNKKTHNHIIAHEDGWVYNKCKQYICTERPKIPVNPYLIEDFATAKEYIRTVPPTMRDSMDIQLLMQKFPELKDVKYE